MSIRGARVLVFGDSLSHFGSDSGPEAHDYTGPVTSSAPGAVLAGQLVAGGAAAARTDARVSRSAVNFWAREDYNTLLAADRAWRPDLVVVMLGTNDLHLSPKSDAQAFTAIRDVFVGMGARVIAIGPPTFADRDLAEASTAVLERLRAVFGPRAVIDGAALSGDLVAAGRSGDGIHFTTTGAAVYGKRLAAAVEQLTEAPTSPAAAIGVGFAVVVVGVLLGRALR